MEQTIFEVSQEDLRAKHDFQYGRMYQLKTAQQPARGDWIQIEDHVFEVVFLYKGWFQMDQNDAS